MKILIISPKNKTVFNFRGDLIKDMINKGNVLYVTGPNREYVEDIFNLGVKEFFETPMIKDKASIWGDIKYFFKLRNVIKIVRPDIVFEYNIKPNIYGSLAAGSCGVKNIYPMVTGLGRIYASDSIKASAIRIATRFLYKRAFRFCQKVIFQNPDDVSVVVKEKYLSLDKCRVVNGSGVNMDRFYKSDIPLKPTFLMVSRIIREKGVLDFIQAARIVKKRVPESSFILLGGYDKSLGALRESDIEDYIKDGTIIFPGEVKDPVSFYGQASIFVLPSYYREGLPRTILESLACGRPVITTDWPGCREPVADGINGFLVPIKSPDILAEKMFELATHRDLVIKMSDAAYDTCRLKYDVKIVNKQMRDIIGY